MWLGQLYYIDTYRHTPPSQINDDVGCREGGGALSLVAPFFLSSCDTVERPFLYIERATPYPLA